MSERVDTCPNCRAAAGEAERDRDFVVTGLLVNADSGGRLDVRINNVPVSIPVGEREVSALLAAWGHDPICLTGAYHMPERRHRVDRRQA